jgi:hypothetical protein
MADKVVRDDKMTYRLTRRQKRQVISDAKAMRMSLSDYHRWKMCGEEPERLLRK